jgi:hypothetical protein
MQKHPDRYVNDVQQPITAESIVDEIIQSDEIENIKDDLSEMFEAFIMNDDEGVQPKQRAHHSFSTIRYALNQIRVLIQQKAQL